MILPVIFTLIDTENDGHTSATPCEVLLFRRLCLPAAERQKHVMGAPVAVTGRHGLSGCIQNPPRSLMMLKELEEVEADSQVPNLP